MLTAVGTKYKLPHEPFVPFDIIDKDGRQTYSTIVSKLKTHDFTMPQCLSIGEPLAIETALILLETSAHGALEEVEGAIWRVERKGVVDFLCKYVKPNKVDGKYLADADQPDTFNIVPKEFEYLYY
jgi:hypothetical protein